MSATPQDPKIREVLRRWLLVVELLRKAEKRRQQSQPSQAASQVTLSDNRSSDK